MNPADDTGSGRPVSGAGITDSIRDAFHPSTPSGQSLAVAAAGFAILLLTIGKQTGGSPVAKVGAVAQWLLLVAAGMVVVNWTGRHFAGLHPDWPGAAGVTFDL